MDDDLELKSRQPPVYDEKKHIPDGLSDLLEMVGREVLRTQPQDITSFLAEYLNRLLGIRDGKSESKSDLSALKLPLPQSLMKKA